MRTLAVVAPSCQLSLRGPLGWRGRCTGSLTTSGGVCLPHLRVMGVWRERPLDVIPRGDTRLPVAGGAVAG